MEKHIAQILVRGRFSKYALPFLSASMKELKRKNVIGHIPSFCKINDIEEIQSTLILIKYENTLKVCFSMKETNS